MNINKIKEEFEKFWESTGRTCCWECEGEPYEDTVFNWFVSKLQQRDAELVEKILENLPKEDHYSDGEKHKEGKEYECANMFITAWNKCLEEVKEKINEIKM